MQQSRQQQPPPVQQTTITQQSTGMQQPAPVQQPGQKQPRMQQIVQQPRTQRMQATQSQAGTATSSQQYKSTAQSASGQKIPLNGQAMPMQSKQQVFRPAQAGMAQQSSWTEKLEGLIKALETVEFANSLKHPQHLLPFAIKHGIYESWLGNGKKAAERAAELDRIRWKIAAMKYRKEGLGNILGGLLMDRGYSRKGMKEWSPEDKAAELRRLGPYLAEEPFLNQTEKEFVQLDKEIKEWEHYLDLRLHAPYEE
jgi:hypothetical protein